MMKRSKTIDLFISVALGMGAGSIFVLTIEKRDMLLGLVCIVLVVAFVLSCVCGDNKDE